MVKKQLKKCKKCGRHEGNLEAKRCVFCGSRRWKIVERVVEK